MENILNYFAGVVDGEGTIGISKCRKGFKQNRQGYCYRAFFHITNTYLPLLQYLQKHFGGRIAYLDERAMCYNHTFSANEIRNIFPELIPYLLVKRRQAEIVLEFLNKMEKTKFCSPSDELYEFYEKCYLECKAIKQIRYDWKPERVPFGMKKCVRCQREFLAYSGGHKYCNKTCKSYAHLERTGIRNII